jgi:hypothetical protein
LTSALKESKNEDPTFRCNSYLLISLSDLKGWIIIASHYHSIKSRGREKYKEREEGREAEKGRKVNKLPLGSPDRGPSIGAFQL